MPDQLETQAQVPPVRVLEGLGAGLDQAQRHRFAGNTKAPSDEEQQVLATLEKQLGRPELLNYLTEHVMREQEIFWSRFAGFAAIHGGTLVLVTSESVKAKGLVSIIGLVLALLWVLIQSTSVTYADRAKRLYHWYRRSLGILWPYERDELAGNKAFSLLSLASTRATVAVPVLVAMLWALAISNYY